ncbi:MAG: hypothetical protein IJT38_05765 [Clostridia bacterium]|nr:hypothetical protein [Clostridia bacterium]
MKLPKYIIFTAVTVFVLAFVSQALVACSIKNTRKIGRGRDTVLVWNDTYDIGHYVDGNHLFIWETKESYYKVLSNIKKHKVIWGKLYIVAEDGYAVIDKKDFCRIFLTTPDEEYVKKVGYDRTGNPIYVSKKVDNDLIEYIVDFTDYSDKEQKILKQLAN